MTTEKIKRSRLVLDLADEDREWIRAQSEATGWSSEALVVRMLIRDARQRGVSFAVVAQQPGAPQPVAMWRDQPLRRVEPQRARSVDVVLEGDADSPPPVADDVVENMLADRLEALSGSAAPFTAGNPGANVLPMIQSDGTPPAFSLRPAPKRAASDYR